MCSPNRPNKKTSSKKRLLKVRFKLLLIFLAHGEWEFARVPQGRLLWRRRAQPSATLDKRQSKFSGKFYRLHQSGQAESGVWLAFPLRLARLCRLNIRIILLLLLGLPRLITLAFGLRRLGNLILIFLFLRVIKFRRHLAPPSNAIPPFAGLSRNCSSGNRCPNAPYRPAIRCGPPQP